MSSSSTPSTSVLPPIACDLTAIPADQRAGHIALVRALFGDETRVRELADGVEVSLEADRLADAVAFIENERRCCRRLAFELHIPAADAQLILRVTGHEAMSELRALML